MKPDGFAADLDRKPEVLARLAASLARTDPWSSVVPPDVERVVLLGMGSSAYAGGVLHGVTRSWHANGARRAEYLYERGSLAMAKAWSESGAALTETEARRIAERDRVTDADFYAGLERTIAENGPRCD